jgi:hypothetical protein
VGEPEPEVVELRCPVDLKFPDGKCRPGRLFLKLRLAGERPRVVQPDNLIELACDDCRKRLAKQGHRVWQVFHYYDMVGELIDTRIVRHRGR